VKVILLHNPTAGTGDHDRKKLTRLIEKIGEVSYCSTKKKNWQEVFEKKAADLIVVAGGDGTVRKVALNAPRGSRLAILPLGTANNVANSLGIGGKHKEIVASWTGAREQPLDLGRAKGPWGDWSFLEGVGVGAVTLTAARMDSGEAKGADGAEGESAIRVARQTLQSVLANGASHWFDVTVDGQSICDKAALLEVANMRYIGPRLALAPLAQHGDGQLDIIWLPDGNRQLLRDWLKTASDEDTDAPVKSCRGSSIIIHHAYGQVRIDDTYWPKEPDPDHSEVASDIEISVDRHALSVLVPE
jgi:diacylglycerol kinase family enzyme